MTEGDITAAEVPLDEIFSDEDFNCRGKIVPIDVVDLMRSIEKIGLQYPILLMPYKHPENPTIKYRIVAGHRRHAAVLAMKVKKTIPAVIRAGLTDLEARTINLEENLKRKSLNVLQEAKALVPFKKAGWGQEDLAKELGMSRGWVQVRFMLLDLPDEIQKEAEAGFVNQEQIREIYGLPPDKQFEAVLNLKKAKERGEKVRLKPLKKRNPLVKKVRTDEEIFLMIELIADVVGMGFYTRCLGWAAGTVSDVELHRDLKEFAEEQGKRYVIPAEIIAALA